MLKELDHQAGNGTVLELIRSRMPGLSPTAQQVADAVLVAPEQVIGMSAARLAELSDSSVGSVVRFCRSMGFPGYQDFKLRVATETMAPAWSMIPDDITPDDRPPDVVEKLFSSVVAELSNTARNIDRDALDQVAVSLRDARRILIVAAGTSLPLASDFGNRLTGRAKLSVSYPTDAQTQQEAARGLGPGDLCFAISHSGTTRDTIEGIRIAAEAGATTAALTSFANAALAGTVDLVVVAGCRPDRHRTADMASRIAHHTVLNALWVLVRHHQQEAFPAVE